MRHPLVMFSILGLFVSSTCFARNVRVVVTYPDQEVKTFSLDALSNGGSFAIDLKRKDFSCNVLRV